MQVKKYEYHVEENSAGKRLDIFLKESLGGYSRNKIKKIIDTGGVYVNKKRALIASTLLRLNDYVEFYDDQKSERFKLTKPDIVYEDEYMLVINKPAGIPTQATYSSIKGTVIEAVENYYAAMGKKQYVRLIHRLDKGTTGVLMISKNAKSNSGLTYQFREKKVRKEYVAIVSGIPKAKTGTIETSIAKIKGSYTRYGITKTGGKPAISRYEVLRELSGHSVVLVKPLTGRTHQIRVHLSHLGHPILGDELYGGSERLLLESKGEIHDINISRVMLHARSISLSHPKDKRKINIRAKMPRDMKYIINLLT
jgi:23S rRNA pseudouridine1911/1915/1917 synthase